MKRVIALLTIAALMFGCTGGATGPKYTEFSIPDLRRGDARIYFYRSAGFAGGGLKAAVTLNGLYVGRAIAGGFFYVDVPPGKYSITSSRAYGMTVTFNIERGETFYVKLLYEFALDDPIYPMLVTNLEGKKEIQDLRYIGTAGATASPAAVAAPSTAAAVTTKSPAAADASKSEDSTWRVIDKSNEFGGITIEYVYYKDSETYLEGDAKHIGFLDKNDNLRKMITYHTDFYAAESGIFMRIGLLAEGERIKSQEVFYSDKAAADTGFFKFIAHYDKNQKETRRELFSTRESALKTGVERIVEENLPDGRKKRLFLDKNGKVLKEKIK